MYIFLAIIIIIAGIGILKETKKENKDKDFLNSHVLTLAREHGITDAYYDPEGIFEDTIFAPCQFLPGCQTFIGNQMLTGTWNGTPFRTGYLNLKKEGSTSQGESTQVCVTSGRLIELTVKQNFPIWYAITPKSRSSYGISLSKDRKTKASQYVIKMYEEKDEESLNTIEPYMEAIHKLIDGKTEMSFGFTGDKIYIFTHAVQVFAVAKKNPDNALRQELAEITDIIDIMTRV